MAYERIAYRLDGDRRARRVLLEGVEDAIMLGEPVIAGDEVSHEGAPRGRRHIIQTALVISRVELCIDNKYGCLVDA